MDNDEKPTGQILSRRDAIRLFGIGGAAFLIAYASREVTNAFALAGNSPVSSPPDCVVRPELPIGPYFIDGQLNRSDIRSDPLEGTTSAGLPLALTIVVSDVSNRSCKPLVGAQVDLWHCDAMGVYSGIAGRGINTTGQKFLRGYQLTNAKGVVRFKTIYPGWYSGRAVHIHFMIRTKTAKGRDYQFTSQFFFDDKLTDMVHSQEPYINKGKRDTLNKSDNMYRSGGDQLLLNVHGSTSGGYTSGINIGLDLNNTKVGASDIPGN